MRVVARLWSGLFVRPYRGGEMKGRVPGVALADSLTPGNIREPRWGEERAEHRSRRDRGHGFVSDNGTGLACSRTALGGSEQQTSATQG